MKVTNQISSRIFLFGLFFTLSLLFLMPEASAQFSIGVNGSMHASKLDYSSRIPNPSETVPSSNFGLGYGFAMELSYRLNPSLLLRTEFAFAERGDDQLTVNAFETPLLLVLKPEKNNGLTYQLFAGPYYGFWKTIEAKDKNDTGGKAFALVDENNTEWGLRLGAGLSLPVLQNSGSIDLRASWTQGIINGLNQGLSFTVGYIYVL